MSEISSYDPSQDPNLYGGNVLKTSFNTLGDFGLGIGSIGPENRTDIDPEVVKDMYERIVAGEFLVSIEAVVPAGCVDGRVGGGGTRIPLPSAAGGTLSIVYGRDLADPGYLVDKTETELVEQTVNELQEKGHKTGVHGDDHGPCGCGACAKAREVYQHISDKADVLVNVSEKYGITISDQEKSHIVERANLRLANDSFFAGDRKSILDKAREKGAAYEELCKDHFELAVAINTQPGKTIDRAKIMEVFGDQYEVFVVDVWSFANGASEVNLSGYSEDADRTVKAMVMQNFATASVLGHSSLPILVV